MWKLLVIFNLLALYCAVSSSPPCPISAVFTSVNLRNVLQWVPGNGTEGDTHFTVQYAIYGDSVLGSKGRRVHWRAVQRCTETAQSWCDLSNETRDLEQGYYARIRAVSRRASSKWVLTQRFDPKSDTSFGPPLVSVDIENNSAIIKLKGPMRYQPDNHTPVVSMAKLYPQMMYNLSIRNSHRSRLSHITVLSDLYKQRLTEYNTEYCFSAKAKFLSMPIECQASEWHCVTTPSDPAIDQLKRVVVGIVVPFVFMCMLVVIGYILYQYLMGKGQKTPYMLEQPTFHQTLLTLPPEKTNVLVITAIKPVCRIQDQHIRDPPPGYGIHGFGSPQEPVQPGDDEPIDYGFVAVAPDITVKKEDDREGKYENREGGKYLKCEHGENKSGDSPVEKEWGAENSQPSSYLSQSSIHERLQKTPATHTMTEVGSLVLDQLWFQNSDQLTQNQGLFLQGETTTEAGRQKEGSKFLGLISNATPQTGPFHIPLNLQNKMGGGLQDEMPVVDEKIDGGVEEVDKRETAPLLSPYATQNINNTFASHTDQSDFIADNEYKEGTIFICMDPKTGKLVLPELEMLVTRENGLGKCGEHKEGGEEEVDATRGKLLLGDVLIRQAFEEDRGWEADDILTKWNLVIPIEE